MANNIISHNCTAANIYKLKKMKYGNPFMWCIIPPEDFMYLYEHYHEINFENFKLEKNNRGEYWMVIDGKFKVFYEHYIYDENAVEPIRGTVSLYMKDIENYIVSRYKARLARMKDEPLFIATDRDFYYRKEFNLEKEDLLKFVDKEDCIVATVDTGITGNNVVYIPKKDIDPKDIAEIILANKDI